MAHEVIAGPGFKLMSLARWIKVAVALRVRHSETITVDSPLLVRMSKGRIVPMTGTFMARMDKVYRPVLKWGKATIHSRRRGFATARSGLHMAVITIAMRHSQGVTMQYVALTKSEKAAITTRLAVEAYNEELTASNIVEGDSQTTRPSLCAGENK